MMVTEEDISKAILDRWATCVVPKEAIYLTNNNAGVNQDKCLHYGESGYDDNLVLWTAPKDCIRIEFEDDPKRNHRYILELESAAKSLGLDYCITGHGGKSDYFNLFNIVGLPLNDDNKAAKMLLIDKLISGQAKDQLDKTNLGWTLSPIIGHQHWKPKYNGSIHKLLRGKNPIEHENKYPSNLLRKIERAKKQNTDGNKQWFGKQEWVKDFLLNFCTQNELPAGSRHFVIEKNLAALIIFNKDKEEIKQKYYAAQGRKHDSLLTWERAILNGEFTQVSQGELGKYIKDHQLNFIVPKPEIISSPSDPAVPSEPILNLYMQNKEQIAEKLYQIRPFFFHDNGFFWVWDFKRQCYEMTNDFRLMNNLKEIADNEQFQITQFSFWAEMLRALKLVGNNYEPNKFKKTWVQFQGIIYDYETKERFNSTPEFFNASPIPWKVGSSSETPIIDMLLLDWVGPDWVIVLKEVMALCLIQNYPLHRIICLHGRGLNGKGVFLRLLAKLIGKPNVCSSNLNKLAKSNFEQAKLHKKLVCLIAETDFSTLKDTSTLKQLSGQDLVSAEFKGKDSFDFTSFATLIIATNSLPLTEDRTDGFYRRWLIIDFPNQFEEGKDPLKDVPDIEYENLCNQLLNILPELVDRGRFKMDGTIEERKRRYEEKSNPLLLFIKEGYTNDIHSQIPFFEFYDKFNVFCNTHGFRELSKKNVSQLLDNIGYQTEKKDIKIDDFWKKWVFVIGLKEISYRSNRSNSTSILSLDKHHRVEHGVERFERYEKEESPIIEEEQIVETIHQKCTTCGTSPSHHWDKFGKPVCKLCWKENPVGGK